MGVKPYPYWLMTPESRKRNKDAMCENYATGKRVAVWAGKKRPDFSEWIQEQYDSGKRVATTKKGCQNHWWKGGITPINQRIRTSTVYRKWRDSVFARDNFTCQDCGVRSGNGRAIVLNADHIKPFSLFPEYRFNLSNGRTLCRDCHKKTPTFAGKMRNYISL